MWMWSLMLFVPMAGLSSHIPTDHPPYTNIDTGGQTEPREWIYAFAWCPETQVSDVKAISRQRLRDKSPVH